MQAVAQAITTLSALGTFVVAVVALLYAKKQVEQAQAQLSANVEDAESTRKLQRDLMTEQAQPYVAMTMEQSTDSPLFVELVVKNYGTTAAKDVHITVDPPPQSAALGETGNPVSLSIPGSISLLAPGQEWRTFWDSGAERSSSGLPDKHLVSISYVGLTNEPMFFAGTLDWNFFKGIIYTERKGLHHLATAASGIEKELKKVVDGRSISVLTRDGALRDARLAARAKAWKEAHSDGGGSGTD